MGVVQRLGDLGDDVHRAGGVHGAGVEHGAGVGALDVLHRHPQPTVLGFPAGVDPDHVRMIQSGSQIRLSTKPGAKLRVGGELRGEHLQRIAAGQRRVARQIHRSHTTGAEFALDGVAGDHRSGRHRHGATNIRYCAAIN